MGKYVKLFIAVAIVLALVLFATMNYSSGFKDQPLKTFLPCDTSKIIYAQDLGRQTWSESNTAYIAPTYKTDRISIQYVQDVLAALYQ